MNGLFQDIHYALRQLHKRRGFTAVAVLTLALGIGLNTSIFSAFDALALRPLPVRDADSIVNVYQVVPNDGGPYRPFSYPEYIAFLDSNDSFSELAAYAWTSVELQVIQQSHRDVIAANGLLVSGSYFSTLGGETTLGRAFLPDEAQDYHAQPVVVLSHDFWQHRFDSNKEILGQTVTLNGTLFTVIGVAAPEFAGTEPQIPDFWIPLAAQPLLAPANSLLNNRGSFWLELVGHLKAGVSLNQARENMNTRMRTLAPEYLAGAGHSGILLTPGTLVSRPDERAALTSVVGLILGAVGIVLLIACANIAGLVLARSTTRRSEFGVRLALGASRSRLMRLLFTENLLIAFAGGSGGLLLAWWLPSVLVRLLQPPHEQTFSLPVTLDLRVILYAALLSAIAGVAVGVVPVWQISKFAVLSWLKDDTSRFGVHLSRSRLHKILVVAEASVCLVLLAASGLLVRALQRAETIDLGFNSAHVLTVSLDLGAHGYDNARAAEFHQRFTERLQNLPGVQSVTIASLPPLGGVSRSGPVTVNGRESSSLPRMWDYWVVSLNYFETLEIPILKGRAFTREDTRQNSVAAIVNQSAARDLWPGENPLGKRFRLGPPNAPFLEVVGIAQNTRGARLWEEDKPYVYLPLLKTTQGPLIQTGQLGMQFLVRTQSEPETLATMLPKIAATLDPNVRATASPLESSLGRWVWFSRMGALLSSILGLLALVLAALGIYGVMAYSMAQRTREIGLRIAFGANRNDIRNLALKEGLRLSLLAVAIGLVISFPAMRLITFVLYGLGPADPLTFITVSVLLCGVALLACYIPARRAAKVDPMEALRYE
jgi:predicted permease